MRFPACVTNSETLADTMRFNDNQSGLFSFLVGCIVVVMAGVGISLLVDRRFGFSKNESELQRDITTGESDLPQLKSTYQELSPQVAASDAKLRLLDENRQALVRRLRDMDQRRTTLEATRTELQPAIKALDGEFRNYRQKFRDMVRAAAVGESLGDLKIRGGREFRKTTIVRVTDVGLEIHHEEGTARVQAPDLGDALRERFQWNDEDRYARLKEESDQDATPPADPTPPPPKPTSADTPTPPKNAPPKPDAEKLKVLRGRVITAKSQVTQLTINTNEAVSKASFGRERSVPGSLETWQNKANRLKVDLEKARQELTAAKAQLMEVAPGDPLLIR